jgi:hypothetical protein
MQEPGNLPSLLDAYIQNRFEKSAKALEVQAYQEFLRGYKIGHAITTAFESVYDNQFPKL